MPVEPYEEDLTEFAKATREILNYRWQETGMSVLSLSKKIGVSAIALHQFLTRKPDNYRKNNTTFQKSYAWIVANQKTMSDAILSLSELPVGYLDKKAFFSRMSEIDFQGSEYEWNTVLTYRNLLKLFRIDSEKHKKTIEKLIGKDNFYNNEGEENTEFDDFYMIYGHPVCKGYLKVADLEFRIKDKAEHIYEYFSRNIGLFGENFEADGAIIPINNMIYLLGDISSGLGIEFISFSEPMNEYPSAMLGLLTTVSEDKRPFSSKVIAIRKSMTSGLTISDKISFDDLKNSISLDGIDIDQFFDVQKISLPTFAKLYESS